MIKAVHKLRVILIGGTSHVGKSTLAHSIALKLGWRHISTDKLARHPGRPWRMKPKTVPEHVAEHYLSLSVDELITDVLLHYKNNVWPMIESLVVSHSTDLSTDCLVMEGSALWPELVVSLKLDNISAIWLTANNDLFEKRIYNESQYKEKTLREKAMIDKFLKRTLVYNERMMDAVNRIGLLSLDLEMSSSPEELSDMCLELLWHRPVSG
ncbi:MAG: 2-phosphoglycerate kinase [Anaerolineae bacterium]|nr:2-phosphoglycerate kinase [Anaerolineae bacterium]